MIHDLKLGSVSDEVELLPQMKGDPIRLEE